MTQYAHCCCAEEEEKKRGQERSKQTNIWQENGIDYILKVHVYIEILTLFFQLDIEHL